MKRPDILFRTLTGPITLALVALGVHLFMRGHNAPGGGFIAGLVVAAAALLARMSGGGQLLALRPPALVPLGLLIAAFAGIGPMPFGGGFLRSAYGYLEGPLIGEFEWATAVLFDLGVFLVVVGTTLTIIDLLAENVELTRIGTDETEDLGEIEGER